MDATLVAEASKQGSSKGRRGRATGGGGSDTQMPSEIWLTPRLWLRAVGLEGTRTPLHLENLPPFAARALQRGPDERQDHPVLFADGYKKKTG